MTAYDLSILYICLWPYALTSNINTYCVLIFQVSLEGVGGSTWAPMLTSVRSISLESQCLSFLGLFSSWEGKDFGWAFRAVP